jgi:hypothetical protein
MPAFSGNRRGIADMEGAAGCRNTPIEAFQQEYPVLLRAYRI